MRKFFKEFKEFATRGSVVDLAVGVIIGTAFSAIVNSLVKAIIMPLIVWLFPVQDLSSLSITLRPESAVGAKDALIWQYGTFLEAVINFIIIAFVIFLMLRLIMRAKGIANGKYGKNLSKEEYRNLKKSGKTKAEIAAIDEELTAKKEAEAKAAKEAKEKESVEYILKEIRDELKKNNCTK